MFSLRGSAGGSRVILLASDRRINRGALARGTRHAKVRRAGSGRPMGAGATAGSANERRVITQRARGGACCSRALGVRAREVGA